MTKINKTKLLKKITIALCCSAVIAALCFSLISCAGSGGFARYDGVFGVNKIAYKNLGTVQRTLPQVSDGGLSRYPEYNKTLKDADAAEKSAIKQENAEYLNYDRIDSDGKLYLKGNALNKKLEKHKAADGLYNGQIPDGAEAVVRKLRITPNNIGNNVTGLYAAPGEIVTVILSEKDAARNMQADIGQNSGRSAGNSIPEGKAFTRMPSIFKSLKLTETINYIGSPFGGPIYIRNEGDGLEPYEVTIIGALEEPCYIYNYTKDEEWERLKHAPGTHFDLEIHPGVRFSMPANYVRDKSAKEMRDASEFWFKAMCLSNKVSNGEWFSNHPVTLCFDTYIPAGAAVAVVGADVCYIPLDWAKSSLNYEGIVKSGAWGTLHEFNHHHQGWGSGGGGEVTNNVSNALTYMLYTDIAASRTENGGLSGWNWVSDAYYSLNKVIEMNKAKKTDIDLQMYVTLAHSFGDKVMIEIANNSKDNSATAWYKAAVAATGYDMTYYLRDLCLIGDIDKKAIEEVKAKNLPVYVPVASLYQSGIIDKNGERLEMGKPFNIAFGKEKELDFSKYIVCPSDYSYEIIEVGEPEHGKLKNIGDKIYTYTPDKGSTDADSFVIKLKLTNKNDGSQTETSLVISLMQNTDGMEADIYENPGYADINDAINDDFSKKATKIETKTVSSASVTLNRPAIAVVKGQIIAPSDGTYTIYLKANGSAVLKSGTNKKDLTETAKLLKANTNYNDAPEGSFFTVELSERTPYYFKLYAMSKNQKTVFALGWADNTQIEGGTPIENKDEINSETAQKAPVIDIPSSYIKHFDAKIKQTEEKKTPNYYAPEFKANGTLKHSNESVKATVYPAAYNQSYFPEYMLDDDPKTMYHTKTNIAFPAVFGFDLGTVMRFNSISVTGRPDDGAKAKRGRIEKYKIFVGDSPADMREIIAGTAPPNKTITLVFDAVTARYVSLQVLSVHAENYVAISSISFGNTVREGKIIDCTNEKLKYDGDWKSETYGTFMNGTAGVTSKGSASYAFYGTDIGVFAATARNYGTLEIKLDDGDWEEVSLYSDNQKYCELVYVKTDLNDGEHKIKIRAKSGIINIDYLGVIETEEPVKHGLGLWWILIGFAIAAALGGSIAAAILLVKRKNRPKIAPNTIKSDNFNVFAADEFDMKPYKEEASNSNIDKATAIVERQNGDVLNNDVPRKTRQKSTLIDDKATPAAQETTLKTTEKAVDASNTKPDKAKQTNANRKTTTAKIKAEKLGDDSAPLADNTANNTISARKTAEKPKNTQKAATTEKTAIPAEKAQKPTTKSANKTDSNKVSTKKLQADDINAEETESAKKSAAKAEKNTEPNKTPKNENQNSSNTAAKGTPKAQKTTAKSESAPNAATAKSNAKAIDTSPKAAASKKPTAEKQQANAKADKENK